MSRTPRVEGTDPTRDGGLRHPPRGGFSLIEVVVALGILSLGISSAIALFAAATAAHRKAIHRSHAATLAEWAIADVESALIRGAGPDDINGAPPSESIARDFPGYELTVAVAPVAGALGEDEAVIRVEVSWKNRGKAEVLEFSQIVTRRAPTR